MLALARLKTHKATAIAATVLGLGLLLTACGALWLQNRIQHAARAEFEQHATRLEAAIQQRFTQPLAALIGVRGLFEAAPGAMNRDTFQAWAESHDPRHGVPGVLALGYVERVDRADLVRFVERERADAAPSFNVRSAGDARDLYVLKYVEPVERNGQVWGNDLGAHPVLRETVERAVTRGEAALSGTLSLAQDDRQRAGFVYLLPIYRQRGGARPHTPERRQSTLLGLAYSAVVLDDLMRDVDAATLSQVRFALRDPTGTAGPPVHDAGQPCQGNCAEPLFKLTREIEVAGQVLQLSFSSTPAFQASVDLHGAAKAAGLGALVSALLAALAWHLASARDRAQAVADRMTAELQSNAKRFELAIEGGNDGLWEWIDVHGHEQWWSPHFYRLLGYEPDELPANLVSFDNLLHPDHRTATFAALEAALAGRIEFDVEYLLRTRNGDYRWFHARAKVYHDANGEPTRMAGALQDIHEQRLAQERVHQRGEQLAALFALSPDGFVAFGADGRVSMVSPAFTRLTGVAAHEVLGQDGAHLLARLRARCEALADASDLASALQPSGSSTKKRRVLEFAGPPRRMLQVAMLAGEGEEVNQLLYLRDITYESEVEHLKTEFLTMAAHELRTPMASIFGFTEMLLHREFSPEKRKSILERMHGNGQTMIALINELLDVSRIEARAGADLDVITLDLNELARDAVFEVTPPDGRPSPELVLGTQPLRVRADPAALRQAVLNLLSNAYKYSPGGGAVCIESSSRDYGGVAQHGLCIIDHGIGLSPDDLARVGERFFRADKSGNRLGAGLGVSIVKQTVELLGGRFEISSREGEGTRATLWLSALAEQAQARAGELELI